MKTCFKCGRALPLGEFYRHPETADGHLGKCKGCTKADVTSNRDARLDAYREYDRLRPKRNSEAARLWARGLSPVHQAARKAHPVPEPCAHCGGAAAHRHHPDYSQPLSIVWLCTGCHGREHARLRRAG